MQNLIFYFKGKVERQLFPKKLNHGEKFHYQVLKTMSDNKNQVDVIRFKILRQNLIG